MTEWTSITSPSVYSFAGSTLAVIDIPLNDVFSIYIFLSLSLSCYCYWLLYNIGHHVIFRELIVSIKAEIVGGSIKQ